MSKKKKAYVSERIRAIVKERAGNRCEYCTDFWLYSASQFQIDNILSEKHGGPTTLENLAFCCRPCNIFKGSDLVTVLPGSDDYIPLYNPRKDNWVEHFSLESDGTIISLTLTGEATLKMLKFNAVEQVVARAKLLELGIMEITG